MLDISVTLLTFQIPMAWLKAAALMNMPFMLATLLTFQPVMSWLNAVALENMSLM